MKLLAVIVLLLVTTAAQAVTLPSKEDARKLTDQVMTKLGAGDIGGLALLKPYYQVPDSEISASVERAGAALSAVEKSYGKPLGAEFVEEVALGKSLVQFTYLQKFDGIPVRWAFIFYNSGGGWVILTDIGDSDIEMFFRE